MAKQDTITELRTCANPQCRKEYTAKIRYLLGARFVEGMGYCPECVKKMLEQEEAKENNTLPQSEIGRQRRLWRLQCGIPPMFQSKDFSNFDRQNKLVPNSAKIFKLCWDYSEKFPILKPQGYLSLILFSAESWGVGKTHLACSIGHRVLDRWNGERISCPVLFVSEPDLFMRIQSTYNYSPEERYFKEDEADIISHLTTVPLLILDDVGKRRVHDSRFIQRIMFSVIDRRYKNLLPIVLTANLNPDKLAEYLGEGDEASFDRLIEMSQKKFWSIEGKSYRRE